MRRIGSHSLGDFPSAVVRIDCERCGRAGSYGRDRLISRFGADAALPDVLMALAECERRADFSRARWATRGTEGGTSGGAESWIMRCNSAIGSRSRGGVKSMRVAVSRRPRLARPACDPIGERPQPSPHLQRPPRSKRRSARA